jgi:hypothetical protein
MASCVKARDRARDVELRWKRREKRQNIGKAGRNNSILQCNEHIQGAIKRPFVRNSNNCTFNSGLTAFTNRQLRSKLEDVHI